MYHCENTLAKPLLLPSLSLQVSGTLQPRWAHSTTAFCLVDGVTEVTMFGGSVDSWGGSEEKQSKLADTTLLQFCKYTSMFLHDSTCIFSYRDKANDSTYMCISTVFR